MGIDLDLEEEQLIVTDPDYSLGIDEEQLMGIDLDLDPEEE